MKVLLSAYACEPNKGSEPGVGWHWAIELAKLGYDVHVLTRANNQTTIEQKFASEETLPNLTFHYYDLKKWQRFWKKGKRGVYLYNFLWQWRAASKAKKLHNQYKFDLVHHITFASIRLPSFMWRLGIPFIFGPAGGGEIAPWTLQQGYPTRGKIIDGLRYMSNRLITIDPFMRKTFKQADQIWLRAKENKQLVPKAYRSKCQFHMGIGVEDVTNDFDRIDTKERPVNILYVGRLLYWKGMHIGLTAFAKVLKKHPDTRLTMLGEGPDEDNWRALAKELEIENNVDWVAQVPQSEVEGIYQGHDIFLFPSLHDSAGMVVLEATTNGLPVICIDTGGPGLIVNEECGVKVDATNCGEREVSDQLATAILKLCGNPIHLAERSRSAQNWAKNQTWRNAVKIVYEDSQNGNQKLHLP